MHEALLTLLWNCKGTLLSTGDNLTLPLFSWDENFSKTFVLWCMLPHLEMTVKYGQYWYPFAIALWSVLTCTFQYLLVCLFLWELNMIFFFLENIWLYLYISYCLYINEFQSSWEVLYAACETSIRTICIYVETLWSTLWNNQQMQLYAVNFIPLLGSLYMFWVFYTPIIRSTIFKTVSTATGTDHSIVPATYSQCGLQATLGVSSWDDTMVCTSGCRYSSKIVLLMMSV